MSANAETGDSVIGIRNNARAGWKYTHLDAPRVRVLAELAFDLAFCVRVQDQVNTGRTRRTLARVIIGRGADTAKAEHDIAASHGAGQHISNNLRLIR